MKLVANWMSILLGFIFFATATVPERLPGANVGQPPSAEQEQIGESRRYTKVVVIKGTISAVQNRMLAIIDPEDKHHMLEVSPSAKIQIDGKKALLQDLKKGQTVEVDVRSSDRQVRAIRAKKLSM